MTCRQINAEASKTFYEDNTFSLVFFGGNNTTSRWFEDSTSTFLGPSTYDSRFSLGDLPAIKKIKHWKIVISAYKASREYFPSWRLLDICKAMQGSEAKSIEVLVIPKGLEGDD